MAAEVTVDVAPAYFEVAQGEDFVLEGIPNEEPGKRFRLDSYYEMAEGAPEKLERFGVHITIPIGVIAFEMELVKYPGGGVSEVPTKFRAFPAECIRVPGVRPEGPQPCDMCGETGTTTRKVRFSRVDGRRLHPDCREESDSDV